MVVTGAFNARYDCSSEHQPTEVLECAGEKRVESTPDTYSSFSSAGRLNEMTLMRNRKAKVKGTIAGFVVIAVGAVIPTWTSYYVGPTETTGELEPLWTAVKQAPDSFKIPDKGLWELHQDNIALLTALLLVAGMSGWAVYRSSRVCPLTPEAEDYQEGVGGAVAVERT
jgi:hypothetical protein